MRRAYRARALSTSSLSAFSSSMPCSVLATPGGRSHPAPKRRIFCFRWAIRFSSARRIERRVRWGFWDVLFTLRCWWVGECGFRGVSLVEGERGRG